MGLVAPQNVKSSWTRDQPCVPCIGRWILSHWTNREVLHGMFYVSLNLFYHSFIVRLLFVQLLSSIWLFVTPWTAVCQASLSFTISWSLVKLLSIELVTPSNHLVLFCSCLLLPSVFPSIRVFSNESILLASDGQSIAASAPVLPMNIQGLFPLRLTGLIYLLSKGLSRVFPNTTVQKHQFFGAQLSL